VNLIPHRQPENTTLADGRRYTDAVIYTSITGGVGNHLPRAGLRLPHVSVPTSGLDLGTNSGLDLGTNSGLDSTFTHNLGLDLDRFDQPVSNSRYTEFTTDRSNSVSSVIRPSRASSVIRWSIASGSPVNVNTIYIPPPRPRLSRVVEIRP
jgi:hypothetical protein